MHFLPFNSLRARFAIAVASVVLVLSCLFGAAIGESSISRLKEHNGLQLSEYAYSMIDRLDRDMSSRSKSLTVLSQLQALRDPANTGEARSLLNHLSDQFPSYSWIGLTDAHGTVVASTDKLLEGADISARPVFLQGKDTTFIGDVHDAVMLAKLLPNPSGEAMKFVDISMPVRDNAGQFMGVLATHLSWKWAAEVGRSLFEPLQKRLPGLEFLVVSKDGTVLLGPKAMIGKPLGIQLDDGSGQNWSVARWQDGNLYLAGFAQSTGVDDYRGLGWTVITRQPADAAFAEAHQLRDEILIWGIVLSVVFALVGWFVAGIITGPVNQIADAAARLSQGADVRIPLLKGSREVETLSLAIRHLVDSLTRKRSQLAVAEGMAYRDTVTGLPNRAALDKYVEAVASESGERPDFGVLCLDLDGFKPVNDRFGHAMGDALLQEVGNRLLTTVRDGDIAVRHGGDEFVLLLRLRSGETLTNIQGAAQRIVAKLAEPMLLAGETLQIGCSIGGALWTGGAFSEALAQADEALYRAKRAGKSQAKFHEALELR
ncbi:MULTISPECIES: sensor domain-containing diguanylate cyclase [Pseudomonas]|uniref:Diguanylate cyclase n=2 Tax=Pseudomonas TaxID=286 RepID=A0A0G3G5W3_9PSED|nr:MULTISPECIES: diguanylate cyclase [Pseudomonas]AKJ96620.1 diguanylate cyclase [Pseudomonas chlororaphis]ROM87527.1 GGDEF domain-containing protein [Pseudomonas brassicacearum]BBP64670.1 diguanylate cyclase [Pseudomonas sp. Cab53]